MTGGGVVPAGVRERPRTGSIMSNLRGIDPGFEDALRAGMTGKYFGWNFSCDYVWFEDDRFHAAVICDHVVREIVSAGSLGDLMRAVSESYGWQ